jgi:uncharacterized protein (DUF1778 family)
MSRARSAIPKERRERRARLGFRVDEETKKLVQKAAVLERRNLTDFCMTALTEAARHVIARHQTLVLSERDQEEFFRALIEPPRPNARLRRAFDAERKRIDP